MFTALERKDSVLHSGFWQATFLGKSDKAEKGLLDLDVSKDFDVDITIDDVLNDYKHIYLTKDCYDQSVTKELRGVVERVLRNQKGKVLRDWPYSFPLKGAYGHGKESVYQIFIGLL